MRDRPPLKGYRLWRSDLGSESSRITDLQTLKRAYVCPKGHSFTLSFSAEAEEIPITWECRTHSVIAVWPQGETPSPRMRRYPPKTPLEHLFARRSIAELETLLSERLREMRDLRTGD